MGTRALFSARKRFFRQIGHHGPGQPLVNIHRHGILGKLVGVDQPAGEFVVSVGGEAIVNKKLGFGIERFGITFDQPIDLRPRCLRASNCTGAGRAETYCPKLCPAMKP